MRWWLDDRETAAGRRHLHLNDAKPDDLAAFDGVLLEELTQREQAERCLQILLQMMRGLVTTDDEEAWRAAEARLYRQGDIVSAAGLADLCLHDRREER
jgi:hypothetical protein